MSFNTDSSPYKEVEKGGRLQKVMGCITTFKADFIVNASNTSLMLGSGVSMVLKRACGPELQKAMSGIREQFVDEQRLIKQGEVFATPAFELETAKYVLHAAVMNYNSGVKQQDAKPGLHTIETILENCIPYFEWFEEQTNQIPSAIFPYLGCGVGGLQKQQVLKVFKNFLTQNPKLNVKVILAEI